ncbi:hypothetical protein [Clostridium sp. BNL1100]|uniref:hypothetical protein n=1 Tax=Clostridium sp. BNL1100 TaxID=755731 RepID=UPI00024A7A92|nr:hypothetical protein [Clostridium sp. BNL1100]AEY66602.1 hypothetical protein Clo1100_2431 [Clostridium sp. BNL1100]
MSQIFKIDRFLGVNLNDTSMQIGEASNIVNFRITDDYKLKKREGYKQYLPTGTGGKIKSMWYGKINDEYHHIFVRDGKVYKYANPLIELGTIPDNESIEIYDFQGILYFLTNGYYKKWLGTGNIVDVEPYIPLIKVATRPDGKGTDYENLNLLTGKKRQKFRSNGTSKIYTLVEQNITSVDIVKHLGVILTPTTDYTVNLTNGTITTTVQYPEQIDDDIEVFWTKGTGNTTDVTNQKYSIAYGGGNDNRILLYGNGNTIIYSGLADGVSSAEYFPANNYMNIGTKQDDVIWLTKQYNTLLIFTDSNAWYSSLEFNTDTGLIDFPTYPLNSKIGTLCKGQLLQNNPFTLYKGGIYEWVSTTVRDEKNAILKSMRIQKELDNIDLKTCLTYDYEDKGEFWICYSNNVWVYNYRLDVFYKYKLADIPTCFLTIDKVLYFGTSTGKIMQFQNKVTLENGTINYDARTDAGQTINSIAELGFMNFDNEYLRKFIQYAFISIYPDSRSSLKLYWQTDKKSTEIPLKPTIDFNFFNFNDIDFSDFTFLCNYNPTPTKVKLKAKKFSYIKLILENNELNDTVTVVSITLPVIKGGYVK